jgi:hypothetical protein
MKQLRSMLFGTTLLCLISGAVAQAQNTTFHANGAFASAGLCSVSGTIQTCIFVNVNLGSTTGTASQTSTFLSYFISTSDSSTGSFQGHSGFGTIPNSAFQVGSKADSLNVDTSTLDPALFTNFTCTLDPADPMFIICAPGALGGVVSGAWQGVPSVGGSQNGTSEFHSPGLKTVTTGTTHFNVALANVSVLGQIGTDPNAQIGTNHNTTINISH